MLFAFVTDCIEQLNEYNNLQSKHICLATVTFPKSSDMLVTLEFLNIALASRNEDISLLLNVKLF